MARTGRSLGVLASLATVVAMAACGVEVKDQDAAAGQPAAAAPWVGRQDQTAVHWTGSPSEERAVRRDLDVASSRAREHDRPLYLGEFGAYHAGDTADRARWTSFVARETEYRGWSWSYWQFDSDFVVYDIPAPEWVEPIRQALLPTPAKSPAGRTG